MPNFLKSVFIYLTVFLFFISLAEAGLRMAGYEPGKISYSQWNKEVKQLSTRHGFAADSNGLFKIDSKAAAWIDSVIQRHKHDLNYKADRNIADSLVYEVYSLAYESLNVLHGKVDNPLAAFYERIKTDTADNDLHAAIINYLAHPVNSAGFRSIEFKPYGKAKKKVLLLGDSFTWGHSATDITSSFADRLLAQDFAIYNTGISGADPAQYAAVAKYYIPLIKPDIVIANFYLGNDVIYFDRTPAPYKPLFFATNAGNLIACPFTTYFANQNQAYDFMVASSYLSNSGWFNRLCAKTSITTLCWMVLRKLGLVWDVPAALTTYYKRELSREKQEPTANELMHGLENLCAQNHCRFVLAIIPELKYGRLTTVSDYKNLFRQQNYFYPASLSISDYRKDDGHFNDEGQKTYAGFLQQFLEKNN